MIVTTLYGFGTVFGILFGYFRFLNASETSNSKELTKYNYYKAWRKIDKWKLSELPHKIISRFILIENFSLNLFLKIANKISFIHPNSLNIFTIIYMIIFSLYLYLFDNSRNISVLNFVGSFILFTLTILVICRSLNKVFRSIQLKKLISTIILAYSISYFIVIIILAIEFNFTPIKKIFLNKIFFINLFCDGLTLAITLYLFKYFHKFKDSILYSFAIIIDLIISALLAFLTLFLIQLFTHVKIENKEIFYKLIARNSTGNSWEISEWFWLMHTTFIPTLIYLSLIFIAILAKLIIIPLNRRIGKASVVDNPHDYSSKLFGFLSLLTFGIAKFIDWC